MQKLAFPFALVLCLIQTEGVHAMSKLDQSLEEAVSAAPTSDQTFPVMILCAASCDPVVAALRETGNETFAVFEELKMITTQLDADTIDKISALDAVSTIELDAEASID